MKTHPAFDEKAVAMVEEYRRQQEQERIAWNKANRSGNQNLAHKTPVDWRRPHQSATAPRYSTDRQAWHPNELPGQGEADGAKSVSRKRGVALGN